MARVQSTRLASSASAATARHKIAVQKTKPSYKVVIEQLTEKKRKLVTVVRPWPFLPYSARSLHYLYIALIGSSTAFFQYHCSFWLYVYSRWGPSDH